MTLPANLPALPTPAPRLPLPTVAERLLPVVRGPLAAAAVGLAAEFALRALVSRALAALVPASRPAAPLASPVAHASRTIVTEVVVRERFRRTR